MDKVYIKALCGEKTRYAFMTANLCNNAVSEMYFLKPERYSGREAFILGTFTVRFYMASLQYMFNAEYCKLFEKDGARKDKNVSSLLRLNNFHLEILGEQFVEAYLLNKADIYSIILSDFNILQRELRDTKYSHSDISERNNFTISPFDESELEIVLDQLRLVLRVVNRMHSFFDAESYFPNAGARVSRVP